MTESAVNVMTAVFAMHVFTENIYADHENILR
jgi:hypothetical protein